jgi:phytoene synthase
LGRQYIPKDLLESVGLSSFKQLEEDNDAFNRLIRREINVYRVWQKRADDGFKFIPFRYRVPIKTASRLYGWTASEIEKNPSIVFDRKVKPSVARIIVTLVKSVFI